VHVRRHLRRHAAAFLARSYLPAPKPGRRLAISSRSRSCPTSATVTASVGDPRSTLPWTRRLQPRCRPGHRCEPPVVYPLRGSHHLQIPAEADVDTPTLEARMSFCGFAPRARRAKARKVCTAQSHGCALPEHRCALSERRCSEDSSISRPLATTRESSNWLRRLRAADPLSCSRLGRFCALKLRRSRKRKSPAIAGAYGGFCRFQKKRQFGTGMYGGYQRVCWLCAPPP